jgi:hypothetical protein
LSYPEDVDMMKADSNEASGLDKNFLLEDDAQSIPFSLPKDLKTEVEHGNVPTMKVTQ